MMIQNFINSAFKRTLSQSVKKKAERIILAVAILSYVIHLIIIFLVNQELLKIDSKFFSNPIAAIYTPFTFILVYEVYLLIYFLPKSISSYIGKQYEIITLIVIRRIFKDIANLELSSNWFQIEDDLQFTYDVVTSLILFALIYFFYRCIIRNENTEKPAPPLVQKKIDTFIDLKKAMAVVLVPILFAMASIALFNWGIAAVSDFQNGITAFKNINNIFFDEFFTALIIVDVLLLLASFFYSDKFYKIIRNSGFVISTILIKVSFSVTGIVNNMLIIGAVIFGFLVLLIHNLYEKNDLN